jgi:tRNA(Ile)-lysidine synthase
MQKEFETYLGQTCQCSPEKTFLLAISGGIDSVVMAWLFYHAGMDFAVAHCNFQLRGAESDADQAFVERLAAHLTVPCYVNHFNTLAHSHAQGISIQMAARELRYDWFNMLKENKGYDYIAVGHNANDTVETVLLNFVRGCGIRGLSGINVWNHYYVRFFTSRSIS